MCTETAHERRIMIPVKHNFTVDTDMCPYTEIFVRTFLTTSAAYLAGFLRVHLHDGDTGPFCLVLNQFDEACPPSI